MQLPYDTHTCYLGPLIGQQHIRTQLYARDFKFVWYAYRSRNDIVKTCMTNAEFTCYSCIGYTLSFFRNTYHIDMSHKLRYATERINKFRTKFFR